MQARKGDLRGIRKKDVDGGTASGGLGRLRSLCCRRHLRSVWPSLHSEGGRLTQLRAEINTIAYLSKANHYRVDCKRACYSMQLAHLTFCVAIKFLSRVDLQPLA